MVLWQQVSLPLLVVGEVNWKTLTKGWTIVRNSVTLQAQTMQKHSMY